MFQGRSERGETSSYLGLISVREDVKISSEATDVHDSVVSEEQKKINFMEVRLNWETVCKWHDKGQQ